MPGRAGKYALCPMHKTAAGCLLTSCGSVHFLIQHPYQHPDYRNDHTRLQVVRPESEDCLRDRSFIIRHAPDTNELDGDFATIDNLHLEDIVN